LLFRKFRSNKVSPIESKEGLELHHSRSWQPRSSQIFLSHNLVGKKYLDKIDISESSVNPY